MKLLLIVLSLSIIIGSIVHWATKNGSGKNSEKMKFPRFLVLFGAVLFFATLWLRIISAQDVGVLVRPSGVEPESLYTGWHIIAPWNKVYKMDRTVWVYTCSETPNTNDRKENDAIWVPTIDGIKIGFAVSVSWRIDPTQAPWIYQNVSENDDNSISGKYRWLEENVIRTKLKSAIAMAANKFTPIECYSNKREEIRNISLQIMKNECKEYKLIVDQIDLRETYYNPDYEKAINAKKLAEQEALRLVEVTKQKEEQLKQASIDKDIAIQKAEGEAKALQIKGQSVVNNPKIVELEWIAKWDGTLPTYMMGSGQGVMLNIGNK
jgi:regulator of protease activity HflC (stomatin/prohibitin superfamily)